MNIFDSDDPSLLNIRSRGAGPTGALPITPEMLLQRPSGDLFGWTQNAGMGWDPSRMSGDDILILSTHGGLREPDGKPIALGYHTGHFEVHLLVEAAARELAAQRAVPFAAYCTDPCDGRTQGTPGMFATTQRWCCAAWPARYPRARGLSAWQRATRACRR